MYGIRCTCLYGFLYHDVQISNLSYYLVNKYKYFILGNCPIFTDRGFRKHSKTSESTIGRAFNQER